MSIITSVYSQRTKEPETERKKNTLHQNISLLILPLSIERIGSDLEQLLLYN
jgi:hypothetical protein